MRNDNLWTMLALVAAVTSVTTSCTGTQSQSGSAAGAADQQDLNGQQLADAILATWRADHPSVDWEADERTAHTLVPSHDNGGLIAEGTQADGHPYRQVTELDVLTWKRETERFVLMGSRIFHSASELGGTVGVSCDMCHPHAANTHPETYPKFQTQLGKVVLLRDMINWCIEQPVRGKPLAEGDPRLRAIEAYVYAQRAGKPLAYGKH